MRKIYYFDWSTGEMSEHRPIRKDQRMQIVPDIKPYREVIHGQMITSRRQHKEFLKANGCVEVGNEKPKPPPPYQGPSRDQVKRAYWQAMDRLKG